MDIKEAIIHRLIKEPNQAKHAEVDPRPDRLPVNDILIKLTQEVVKTYTRTAVGYGTFNADQTVHLFPGLAKQYVDEQEDFVPFSHATAKLVADRMKQEAFASGGYLLLVRYEAANSDWLIAAMLKLKPGTAVDEKKKELLENLGLDVEHLHEAARINIPKWQADEQPYLSFVKKRAGKDDITRYFRSALGCTDYTHSKHHTEQTMNAIKKFMKEKGWDSEKKNSIKQKVHDYFKENNKNGEDANINSVASFVNHTNPSEFIDFLNENYYNINENFAPHPRTFRTFRRLSGKVGNINMSLDVADVINGKVKYENQTGNIVITKAGDSQLAKDISEYQNDNSD